MLDYDWSTAGVNASSVMLSADVSPDCPDPSHGQPMVVDYSNAASAVNQGHHFGAEAAGAGPSFFPPPHFSHHQQQAAAHSNFIPFYEGRGYGGASASYYHSGGPSAFYHESFPGPVSGGHFMAVPKIETEPLRPVPTAALGGDLTARIGLNLGGRTYFSSAEDDFVSRLYRRNRPLEAAGISAKVPRCQAEGCSADLTHAKHYNRRHKVCEFHSKAAAVLAAGLTQRFCQQCSRFHLLSEFDNGKRSCRKRLADHNRRRRKSQQQPSLEVHKSALQESPQDSGNQSSSSVTIAVSPLRIPFDCCFRQRSTYNQQPQPSSSASSCSLFFSSG